MRSDFCDGRPRIYLDACRDGASWRLSPNGIGTPAPTAEAAFLTAMAAIDWASAVIIWKGDL